MGLPNKCKHSHTSTGVYGKLNVPIITRKNRRFRSNYSFSSLFFTNNIDSFYLNKISSEVPNGRLNAVSGLGISNGVDRSIKSIFI